MTRARMMVLGGLAVASVVGVGVGRGIRARHHDAEGARAPTTETAEVDSTYVRKNDNPNVRSIVEARRNRNHPERLSPLLAPTPFDADAFDANPQAYLDVVEPGRCFQMATKIGPTTPLLRATTPRFLRSPRGDEIPLLVMGAPNAPVTFTAFAGGSFRENGLNSISVRADARGYAVVHFATPVTARGVLPVLVGSPLAVGHIRYLVQPS